MSGRASCQSKRKVLFYLSLSRHGRQARVSSRVAACPLSTGQRIQYTTSRTSQVSCFSYFYAESTVPATGTWSLQSLATMLCRTVTQVRDGAVLKMEQESGMYVIVVKTANRVLRFSHQNPSEAFRWLQAFVDAGQGLSD